MTTIHIRRVADPGDPAIAAFGALQERVFPDPDLLIPPHVMPFMVARQTKERRNILLVAEVEGAVVGGTLFHYLAVPQTGFSSFMAVAPECRGQGVARKLHQARWATLITEGPVHGIFIDVVAPERLPPEDLARERAFGLDPADRRRVFHRLGFRRVDVAYYQPPGGPGEEPITTMDLLYCPHEPADFVATDVVVGTMHAYWTPWLGRQTADTHAAELRRRCGGDQVALKQA
ncbi:MAG TPA: GNAT family N-acetyltransferase [Symbiobacteriaceae bacterium]|nr:GNAT family N-acetyltransferase [Symbiobacteriaceae bacterium]